VKERERERETDRQTKMSIEENRWLFGPTDFMALIFYLWRNCLLHYVLLRLF